ncbi:hypothetical protein ACSFBM_00135 [Variovorax sp. GB1R11]|uniref:hypothetical protein n=1 Tax=Variovorax sp. GB1R11 TaxID=3443741 RepID=UPI003F479980
MEFQEIMHRFWTDMMSRPSGPYAFRFVLQPVMAVLIAVLNGIQDAKTGRSPYFWTIVHDPAQRSGRLREGVKATTRILLLGVAMEAMYQIKTFGFFYVGEAIAIIFFLAFLPYLLVRGPAARVARWWLDRSHKPRQPG